MHKNKHTVGIANIPDTVVSDKDSIPMLDEDYERSLINILPEGTAQWFKKVPEEWLLMPEAELKELFYPHECGKKKVTGGRSTYHLDQQLRMAFWSEYDSAQNNVRKFIPRHVYMNVIHISNWYNCVLPNAKRLAWIMCPPGSYVAKTSEVFMAGLDLMKEYLDLGVQRDEKGYIDSKLAAVQQKIFEGAQMRVRGSIPMKVMEQRLSYNVNKSISDDAAPTKNGYKIEDLETQLQQLRKTVEEKERQQICNNDIIDVSPTKDEKAQTD